MTAPLFPAETKAAACALLHQADPHGDGGVGLLAQGGRGVLPHAHHLLGMDDGEVSPAVSCLASSAPPMSSAADQGDLDAQLPSGETAPSTTTPGAWSPPMASRAIRVAVWGNVDSSWGSGQIGRLQMIDMAGRSIAWKHRPPIAKSRRGGFMRWRPCLLS